MTVLRDVHKKPNHSLTSCGTCSFLRRFAQGSSAVGAQTPSSPRRRVRPPWRSSSPWACCGATMTMESSLSTLRSVARRIDEMTQARAPALLDGLPWLRLFRPSAARHHEGSQPGLHGPKHLRESSCNHWNTHYLKHHEVHRESKKHILHTVSGTTRGTAWKSKHAGRRS